MELTIKEQVYQFNFGMGFLREMNRKVTVPVDGIKDVKRHIGLRYTVSGIMDGDVEALEELLVAANKDQNPRVTTALLDEYIDDPETDIDQLFEDVLDFLKNAKLRRNACRRSRKRSRRRKRNRKQRRNKL